ncbi:MAG: hypothetical protein M3390_12395 [Chloroflexota bacterium]|nr:hypothetical protein [Chloroflexota bacterium]
MFPADFRTLLSCRGCQRQGSLPLTHVNCGSAGNGQIGAMLQGQSLRHHLIVRAPLVPLYSDRAFYLPLIAEHYIG